MPWVKCDAFHVVCVPHVVPLLVCLHVVKNHHGSNGVTNLAWAGKAENVATPACLPSPVPVNPFHIKVKFGSLQFKIRVPAFLQLCDFDCKNGILCYLLFPMFHIFACISIRITIYLWELWTQWIERERERTTERERETQTLDPKTLILEGLEKKLPQDSRVLAISLW